MFQFPSNGKSYPKCISRILNVRGIKKFQFPSNGKSYPKRELRNGAQRYLMKSFNSLQTGNHIQRKYGGRRNGLARLDIVSIPFKREIISKAYKYLLSRNYTADVSIPFKREIISKVTPASRLNMAFLVSIPFKREIISKAMYLSRLWISRNKVSIPFKREIISKVYYLTDSSL